MATRNQTAIALPDPRICRAKELTDLFAHCLVSKASACRYAIPFGFDYLCGHPDREAIIANTKYNREHGGETIGRVDATISH